MTDSSLQIRTASGELLGSADAGVRSWKGIPYAAPPVGRLRWRGPAPVPAWSGVRPALAYGPDFLQAPHKTSLAPGMDEDCLYLNVWSPEGAEPGSLPVMVWVHGGGFVGGSGADARTDGTRMARQGVVVVSFNYRSGLFGFLAHPALSRESEHRVSGNYGLLDQLQALRWVRENIAAFGGNPRQLTTFGVSAGSASISLLLVSPLAAGAFDQTILHSPGAARPLATLEDAEIAGTRLGDDIDALRGRSAQDVFGMTGLLAPKVRGLTTPRVLRPIRDGWMLPEDERPAFKGGRLHRMPTIVGSNADEGTLLTAAWPVDSVAQHHAMVETNFGAATAEALTLYPADSDALARPRIAEIFADTQFNYGTRLIAQAMSALEPRTWRYLFTRRRPGQDDGPHHGEEVSHVFGNLSVGREGVGTGRFDATDEAVSASMMSAWVNFARSADPNGAGAPQWPAYTPASDTTMAFGDSASVVTGWRRPQLDFLDRFFEPSRAG